MAKTPVITLDLDFQGRKDSIGVYLIPHSSGVVMIECGPGSTLAKLQAGLAELGYSAGDVTHVFVSHIHLDHAGTAGWLARQGAQIYVHPVGGPHLLNPEKLLASATRIYGDKMDTLWGEFLAVPEEKLNLAEDGQEVAIGDVRIIPISTPGHAEHHNIYLYEDLCFSGDVGGVRIPGFPYLRVPMPPPELNLERWRETIGKMKRLDIKRMAPTHFGIFEDPDWQLEQVLTSLDEAERWLETVMPGDPPVEDLREMFINNMEAQGREKGLSEEVIESYRLANPLGMSADGLQRYWRKYRSA